MKKFIAAALGALLILSATVAPAFAQSTATGTVGGAVYACPQLSYNLYWGLSDYSTAGQVTSLQQFLNSRYGNQRVTGYFGPLTYANVARFQYEQGVYPVTGGVGPLTRAAIARVCGGAQPVTGGLSANPSSGTAPLGVTFSATMPDANQYIIDFGDGSNSGPIQGSRMTVTHTYGAQGTYTATLSRYISCMYSNPRCMIAVMPVGTATVQVSAPVQTNILSVTSPNAGQVYTRGSDMSINWSGLIRETFAYEPHASIVDLYTAAGVKVGTIAITNDLAGTYSWRIPPFPNIYMCTMQYPNGLCGTNVQGQYYIKVTAVVGNGFDPNETVLGTAQSGVFTIQ